MSSWTSGSINVAETFVNSGNLGLHKRDNLQKSTHDDHHSCPRSRPPEVEAHAFQCISAGPCNAIPSCAQGVGSVCGFRPAVVGIHFLSASRSAVYLPRVQTRSTKDLSRSRLFVRLILHHFLHSAANWDKECLVPSMVRGTAEAFNVSMSCRRLPETRSRDNPHTSNHGFCTRGRVFSAHTRNDPPIFEHGVQNKSWLTEIGQNATWFAADRDGAVLVGMSAKRTNLS